MLIGVGLDARLGLSLAELSEVAAEGARAGFQSVWTPAGGVPDAFHVCALWSRATAAVVPGGLKTGISVVPAARLWTVPALALQSATLSVISGGRFVLGIGTGGYGESFFRSVGMPNRPIAVMGEYVTTLRQLLAGEKVTFDGIAVKLDGYSLGVPFAPVPVHIAALGPGMLRLAGERSDGALLNWATPDAVRWSRDIIAEGAARAGRDPSEVAVSMYIRVCIDDDVQAARRAFGAQVLGYAFRRPGIDPSLGYRGHFARMGFDDVLADLERRQDAGASMDELVDAAPDELFLSVGYYGPAAGAAEVYRRLSVGLDETIVRVITARPGVEPVLEAMRALTPARIAP